MDNRRSNKPRAAARGPDVEAEPQRMPLPPGCTQKHGRFFVVRHNKWHPLTRVSDGEVKFWRAYYKLTGAEPNSMAGVMLAYLEDGMGELAEETRESYEKAIVLRLIPYCGHMRPDALLPTHVAQYLEERKRAGAPVSANRERAALSSSCNFAMRKGWMTYNPCLGVRRNKERPSRRYVEHEELKGGIDKAAEPVQDLLAVAYLTGARQIELRLMRVDQVGAHDLTILETKTGKKRTMEITPTLRYFLDRARARAKALGSKLLFTSARGRPWTKWGIQGAMRRLAPGFRFRELRAKAASDTQHNILGHAAGMLAVYKRRDRVKAVK